MKEEINKPTTLFCPGSSKATGDFLRGEIFMNYISLRTQGVLEP